MIGAGESAHGLDRDPVDVEDLRARRLSGDHADGAARHAECG